MHVLADASTSTAEVSVDKERKLYGRGTDVYAHCRSRTSRVLGQTMGEYAHILFAALSPLCACPRQLPLPWEVEESAWAHADISAQLNSHVLWHRFAAATKCADAAHVRFDACTLLCLDCFCSQSSYYGHALLTSCVGWAGSRHDTHVGAVEDERQACVECTYSCQMDSCSVCCKAMSTEQLLELPGWQHAAL